MHDFLRIVFFVIYAACVCRNFRNSDTDIRFGVEVYGHGILLDKNIEFERASLLLQLAVRRISYGPPGFGMLSDIQ